MFNHVFIFFILLSLVGVSFAGINYSSKTEATRASTINSLLAKGYTMEQAISLSKKAKKVKKKIRKKVKKKVESSGDISFLNLKETVAKGLKK